MGRNLRKLSNVSVLKGEANTAFAIVQRITEEGCAEIILEGADECCRAESILEYASRTEAEDLLVGSRVIVAVQGFSIPVILGVISKKLWKEELESKDSQKEKIKTTFSGQVDTVKLDEHDICLKADRTIRLECGRSSLLLRKDGTVIVRGLKIISRAVETNKIRGGTVSIN